MVVGGVCLLVDLDKEFLNSNSTYFKPIKHKSRCSGLKWGRVDSRNRQTHRKVIKCIASGTPLNAKARPTPLALLAASRAAGVLAASLL